MNGAGQNIPFVGPYLAFATMYINSWMGAIQAITLLKVDNYIITIAFAYIGGIIADQTRREMEYIAAHSGHETNIVVGRRAPCRPGSGEGEGAEVHQAQRQTRCEREQLRGDEQRRRATPPSRTRRRRPSA